MAARMTKDEAAQARPSRVSLGLSRRGVGLELFRSRLHQELKRLS